MQGNSLSIQTIFLIENQRYNFMYKSSRSILALQSSKYSILLIQWLCGCSHWMQDMYMKKAKMVNEVYSYTKLWTISHCAFAKMCWDGLKAPSKAFQLNHSSWPVPVVIICISHIKNHYFSHTCLKVKCLFNFVNLWISKQMESCRSLYPSPLF